MKLPRVAALVVTLAGAFQLFAAEPVPPSTAFTRTLLRATNAAAARTILGVSNGGATNGIQQLNGFGTNTTLVAPFLLGANFLSDLQMSDTGIIIESATPTIYGTGGNLGILVDNPTNKIVGGGVWTGNGSGLTNVQPQSLAATNSPAVGKVYTAISSTSGYWATAGSGAGDLLAANNLSDLANVNTGRTNLGAHNASNLTIGTVPDARLSGNVSLLGQTISLSEMANMSTGKLLGRSTAGSGIPEELSVGSGLSLSSGTLSATGGAGFPLTASTLLLTNADTPGLQRGVALENNWNGGTTPFQALTFSWQSTFNSWYMDTNGMHFNTHGSTDFAYDQGLRVAENIYIGTGIVVTNLGDATAIPGVRLMMWSDPNLFGDRSVYAMSSSSLSGLSGLTNNFGKTVNDFGARTNETFTNPTFSNPTNTGNATFDGITANALSISNFFTGKTNYPFVGTDGNSQLVQATDARTLTNVLGNTVFIPTNAVAASTIDFSLREATTNAAGAVGLTTLSNLNSTNYNWTIIHVLANGADRTITPPTNFRKNFGTAVVTNGTVSDFLAEVQVGVFSNFFKLDAF